MDNTQQQPQRLVQPQGEQMGIYVPQPRRSWIPARYVFAVLSAIGFAIIYGLKVNLSVCVVAMVNHSSMAHKEQSSDCPSEDNTKSEDGPFNWSETSQGILLGSYFWGYMVSELPGGRLSELYSAKWVMFGAVAINVVCTLLTPPAAYFHLYALVFLRVLEGLGGGMTFPAMHVLIAHWAPPAERAVITAIIYAGTALGTVVSFPMSGAIADALGWEWVFYIMGILSSLWMILWWWLVKDKPEQQTHITDEEKKMIQDVNSDNKNGREQAHTVPWKAVFTSLPFWAILISHLGGNVGWYMLLTQLPTYMKQVLNFKIKSNATLSAVPYLCMWLYTMILGKFLDILRDKGFITQTGLRKIATSIAAIGSSICLIAVTYVGCDKTLAVVLMVLAVTCMGSMFVGYLGNHIDIAHNYAGTLMAITNTVATIPGITVPVIVGALTENDSSVDTWRYIFSGTAGINILYLIFYLIFGTAKEEPWDKID